MTRAPLILVVEDDASVLEMEKTLLESEGYDVVTARDGLEGLLKAEFRHPSLIILDVMMPNVSGGRLYDEIRSDPRLARTPVLIVTGMADAHAAFDGIAGPENVIAKPFALDTLLDRVRALAGPPPQEEGE